LNPSAGSKISKTGVYRTRNVTNTKCYIGSAAGRGFDDRWNKHIRDLNNGSHHSAKLQSAWNKYGETSFSFEILEECSIEQCIEREQYYLDTLLFASAKDNRFNKLGYNIYRIAGSPLGFKHSKASKEKMRLAHLGSKNHNYGKPLNDATKQKMSGPRDCIKGEKHPRSKLTDQQRSQIQELGKQGISQRKRAKMFGVGQATIYDIDHKWIAS